MFDDSIEAICALSSIDLRILKTQTHLYENPRWTYKQLSLPSSEEVVASYIVFGGKPNEDEYTEELVRLRIRQVGDQSIRGRLLHVYSHCYLIADSCRRSHLGYGKEEV